MSIDKKNDVSISKTLMIVYEVDGERHEAVPVTDEEASEVGLTSASCTGTPPCDGHYRCIGSYRWRCMLNHEYKRCQYYKTTERC